MMRPIPGVTRMQIVRAVENPRNHDRKEFELLEYSRALFLNSRLHGDCAACSKFATAQHVENQSTEQPYPARTLTGELTDYRFETPFVLIHLDMWPIYAQTADRGSLQD
jgi:hypothetical protein